MRASVFVRSRWALARAPEQTPVWPLRRPKEKGRSSNGRRGAARCVHVGFGCAGSGLSDGEYISLGWFERDDLQALPPASPEYRIEYPVRYSAEYPSTSLEYPIGYPRLLGWFATSCRGTRPPAPHGPVLTHASTPSAVRT
jgi:hypothetical protein